MKDLIMIDLSIGRPFQMLHITDHLRWNTRPKITFIS